MQDKKRVVPKRRFKEFEKDGAWKQCELKDGTFRIGDGLHGTPKYVDDSNIYFINGNNLTSGRIRINNETKQVSEKERLINDKALDINTILMSINGTIGNLAFYQGEEVMLGKSVAYIKLTHYDKMYIYAYLQTSKTYSYFTSNLTGSTIKNLGLKTIRELKVLVPKKKEQEFIGNFFLSIDNLITLQQDKLKKIKDLKSAYLSEMFPKEGEKYPKIRFEGFNDAWEQREFDSEVELFRGLTYSPNDVNTKGTFVLRSSNVKNGEIVDADNVYVDSEVVDVSNVREDDIIVVVRNGSRSLIGKHAKVKRKMSKTVIGAFMTGIRSNQPNFINAILDTQKFNSEMEKNFGATINQITNGMFRKMKFMFPSIEEQELIGTYFDHLDNLVILHQRKLEKLQETKKAYLNEMFI